MKTLRLILGDQLNQKHSWFQTVDNDVIYIMAEMRQETDYVKHHVQKIVAFFLGMRSFSKDLTNKGHNFIYLNITDENNPQNLEELIKKYLQETSTKKFEYQLPDEYRLDEQLKRICTNLKVESLAVDTEHFYTERDELQNFFKGKKQLIMESFYRMMRKKHDIMMVNGQPDGGKWNYDQSNRKKWKGQPEIPQERDFKKDVSAILQELEASGVKTFGEIEAKNFSWPTSRSECLSVLTYFCDQLLVHFGDYQDAMHTQQKYLFHLTGLHKPHYRYV